MASGETLSFEERVVIVTGAGSGLGREYARQLASRGARVVANGRSKGNIAETVEMIRNTGGDALGCVVDVTEIDAGERIVGAALEQWGRLDALVNNAGVGHGGTLGDFSQEEFDAELAVSLGASIRLSHAAWPHLCGAGSGRIVNTSSSTIFGTPRSIPYTSAKAAVVGMTRGLAIDGIEAGIRVNAVMPLAYTPMNASLPNEECTRQFHDHFPVQEAAALILLLAHERAPTTGETFVTGGGFTARVALVMGSGLVQEGASPEGLLERFDDVMSLLEGWAPEASHSVRMHIIERQHAHSPQPSDEGRAR
jgi:NAD(P)-dependent dehydrogenase (short-subunit alcohol dehydrogenase family)